MVSPKEGVSGSPDTAEKLSVSKHLGHFNRATRYRLNLCSRNNKGRAVLIIADVLLMSVIPTKKLRRRLRPAGTAQPITN